eukprot:1150049-Pelagomonas_calceolata.AAC.14
MQLEDCITNTSKRKEGDRWHLDSKVNDGVKPATAAGPFLQHHHCKAISRGCGCRPKGLQCLSRDQACSMSDRARCLHRSCGKQSMPAKGSGLQHE